MQSFESELGTPFPLKLEANHVIHESQVCLKFRKVEKSCVFMRSKIKKSFLIWGRFGLLLLELDHKVAVWMVHTRILRNSVIRMNWD